ncbi:RWD domain protein [Gregarina niphandrodes]|uniref:RWD domain protein n=1 Tax=Gregarina niphandrodes TaxID=110365 RepID=A0A023BD44_GRENI|nr:RWD domain protein [Gregarina niphandrodes]EZG87284.1 RWD domain protein [Gregarina niphandrodes]|eukprot:XP_011128680.1 RWD domain protein [Gregarina niphandrodes]
MYRWLCTATDARSSSLVGYLLRPSERVHIVKNAAHNIIQVVLSESLATLEERVYAAWVCKHIHTCRIRKNNIGKWTVKLLLTPPKGITRARFNAEAIADKAIADKAVADKAADFSLYKMNDTLTAEIESIKTIFEDFSCQAKDDGTLTLPLVPYPGNPEHNIVQVTLTLSGLENYPDTVPQISYLNERNIDDVRRSEIRGLVNNLVETHQGFEMLYDLYTELTTYLQEHNTEILSVHDKMQGASGTSKVLENVIEVPCFDSSSDRDHSDSDVDPDAGRLADKEVVQPDYRVTEQQFLEWKAHFKHEMINSGKWKDVDLVDSRPTGKQLFTSGQVKEEPALASQEVM